MAGHCRAAVGLQRDPNELPQTDAVALERLPRPLAGITSYRWTASDICALDMWTEGKAAWTRLTRHPWSETP
jgi:hypothetical protein